MICIDILRVTFALSAFATFGWGTHWFLFHTWPSEEDIQYRILVGRWEDEEADYDR